MVWKILRPHYWMLDRKVRTTNRLVVIGLLLLVGFGGQWIYDNLIRDNLALLSSEQAVVTIASALPMGLLIFIVFAMLGIGDVMYQLYLAPDLELLMAAPIPYRTIFLAKLLPCSRATWIPAFATGALLLALGAAREAAASYYLLIALLILAVMTLTTATIMILVILLARLLPAQTVRSWMPVVIVPVTFALVLSLPLITNWLLSQANLVAFLTEALLSPQQLGLVTAGFLGGALAASLAGYLIFDASFHEGWDRFRVAPTGRGPALLGAAGRRWGLSRLVAWLPAPLRHFLVKEWLELRRNPRGPITLAQPLIVIVMLLLPFMSIQTGIGVLTPFIFWFLTMTLVLLLSLLPLGASLMTIAEEGRKLALLRSAPISMSDVLKGKFWATWPPVAFSWVLILLIAGLLLNFSIWQIGFLLGVTIWGLAGATLATMAIGGLKIDFSVEELKQRVPTLTTYLMMGLNMIFVLLTIVTFVWFTVRFLPDSQVVVAIQALAGHDAVGWLSSDLPWFPLVLGGGQVAFWIGLRSLWNAAVRRLEEWEEGGRDIVFKG